MCPRGRRFLEGVGGLLEPGEAVCHFLLIAPDPGLVRSDTRYGVADTRDLGRLGPVFRLLRPKGVRA
jgi:hypothetical protein